MFAIEATGLSYAFAPAEPVLRDVGLAVPRGAIYGFLGPNGAGKTTTLRLLLGLLRPQRGHIRIFGATLADERRQLLRRIGSAIETPSLYAHLTVTENLEVWRLVYDCAPARIDEALQLVGLGDARRKPAGALSLGTKQRLSLAIALLHTPELLILDEPTNGLDPHGIREMRALLTTLNRTQGTTILVSSHLLSEVERVATHVGVLHQGRLLFQGTLAALRALDGNRGDGERRDLEDIFIDLASA